MMPELPECEVMTQNLRSWGMPNIEEVTILRNNGKYLPGEELNQLLGAHINGIDRRGKFIVFHCHTGLLVCHNAMSGYWDTDDEPWTFDYVEGKRTPAAKDVRVTIKTSTNGKTNTLRFHDTRLFGSLRFYKGARKYEDVPSLKDLGPDALNDWNVLDLAVSVGKSSWPIKAILMDQREVAGIGNIYSSEACWRAGVDPRKLGKELTIDEIYNIYQSCRNILQIALDEELCYEKYLRVYRKNKCPGCEGKIMKEKIGGRSTYFCESCQK